MKKVALLLFTLFNLVVNGQSLFQKAYGTVNDEKCTGWAPTPDGGFLGVGSLSYSDIYFVKTDSDGVMQWTKSYNVMSLGGVMYGTGNITPTNDGGFVTIANVSDSTNVSYILLLKINASGVIQWHKTYGNSNPNPPIYEDYFGTHIIQTSDGGYIITGSTSHVSACISFAYTFKTDSIGNVKWSSILNGGGGCQGGDGGLNVIETPQKNYILGASVYDPPANQSIIYLVKYDTMGNVLKEHGYFIPTNYSSFSDLLQTPSGDIFATGAMYTNAPNGGCFLLKVDTGFNQLWCKEYKGFPPAGALIIPNNKGYVLAANNKQINLLQVDSAGNFKWATTFGDTTGSNYPAINTIMQNNHKQFIIGGQTKSFGSGQTDFLLLKTDTLGNTFCNTTPLTVTTTSVFPFNEGQTTKSSYDTICNFILTTDTFGCAQTTLCYTQESISKHNYYADIKIYPNPAQNNFTVEVSTTDKQLLQIIDISGKIVLQQTIIGTTTIDASQLESGVYFVQLKNAAGIATQKIVVQH